MTNKARVYSLYHRRLPREVGRSQRRMSPPASGVAIRHGSVVFRLGASQFRRIVAIFDKPRSRHNPTSFKSFTALISWTDARPRIGQEAQAIYDHIILSDTPTMIIGEKAAQSIPAARKEPTHRHRDRAEHPAKVLFAHILKGSKLSAQKERPTKATPAFSPPPPTSATNERPEP